MIWAGQMSQQEIERGRAIDRTVKEAYFDTENRKKAANSQLPPNEARSRAEGPGLLYSLWLSLKRWWNT